MSDPDTTRLPPGYIPVEKALESADRSFSNVIGFVTDAMPPRGTSRAEFMTTLTICDVDFMQSRGGLWTGVQARLFNKVEAELPNVKIGDIVALKNISKLSRGPNSMLVSHWGTRVLVFPSEQIPELVFASAHETGKTRIRGKFPEGCPPSADEELFVIRLHNKHGTEVIASQQSGPQPQMDRQITITAHVPSEASSYKMPNPSNRQSVGSLMRPKAYGNRKFSLIQDVKLNQFYDMIVEVVKIFPNRFGEFVELYVTDYTSHKDLYDYGPPDGSEVVGRDGDEYGFMGNNNRQWRGPFGRLVLRIEAQPPHMQYIQSQLLEGDCVELKNVRIKYSGKAATLEGNMWADSLQRSKILVNKINAAGFSEGQQLLERRQSYWAGVTGPRRGPDRVDGKKKKRKSARRAAEQAAADVKVAKPVNGLPGIQGNKHVRSSNPNVPVSTLSSMLSLSRSYRVENADEPLPFVNQRRRCLVRAVDFFPSKLEDFAVKAEPQLGGRFESPTQVEDTDPPWEWDFFLLVEDAIPSYDAQDTIRQVWVHISNLSGQYLLNLDACDLSGNPDLLSKLQQKLEILWGNLAELKHSAETDPEFEPGYGDYWSGRLQNVPFDCCIEEYGQALEEADDSKGEGWLRLYSLFETIVM